MTTVVSEWQREENEMEKDGEPTDEFQFFPLHWIGGGYNLKHLSEENMDFLEGHKIEYMQDRGYVLDGNNGYDAGVDRTSWMQEFGK